MTEKEQFKSIVKSYIHRDGIDKLMETLEKTDFYTAPASTRYHDSVEGGLCHHSLRVFASLESELETFDKGTYPIETIALVSLFHDLCKIGFYKVSSRNVKDEFGKWIQVPYYEVEDLYPLGHGNKSVDLLRDFMVLTQDEKLAINAHMGGFDERTNVISNTFSMCPLSVYLHIADLKATYLN